MLKKFLTNHRQALNNSFKPLMKSPLSTLMTVLVIAMTLTLPALLWVMSCNIAAWTENWQRQGSISLYLKVPLSSVAESELLMRVRETSGVLNASLTSSSQGLAAFLQQEGMHDIMHYLPENPLPAVIDVTPDVFVNSPLELEQLYQRLKSYPNVSQAKFDMEWVQRLYTLLNVVAELTRGLMMLLALVVALIIGNTLRLAIHSRHDEIQILKLIGATDAFIMRPFLYTGIWYGLAGASFAVLFVNGLIIGLASLVQQLAMAYQMQASLLNLSIFQSVELMLMAIILGWLGTKLSIKKQLATIDPCG